MLNHKPHDRIVHVIVRAVDGRRRAGYPNSGRAVKRVVVRVNYVTRTERARPSSVWRYLFRIRPGRKRQKKNHPIFVYAFGNYEVTATANNHHEPRNVVKRIFSFRNKKKKPRRYNYV